MTSLLVPFHEIIAHIMSGAPLLVIPALLAGFIWSKTRR